MTRAVREKFVVQASRLHTETLWLHTEALLWCGRPGCTVQARRLHHKQMEWLHYILEATAKKKIPIGPRLRRRS